MTPSMTWIQATSQQMSPTQRHWPFLRVSAEKGAQAGTQSPRVFTKGRGEGAGGAAWMDRSNCRAGRSPGEAGRAMKEAQMSLCWTPPRSAALQRPEQETRGRAESSTSASVQFQRRVPESDEGLSGMKTFSPSCSLFVKHWRVQG